MQDDSCPAIALAMPESSPEPSIDGSPCKPLPPLPLGRVPNGLGRSHTEARPCSPPLLYMRAARQPVSPARRPPAQRPARAAPPAAAQHTAAAAGPCWHWALPARTWCPSLAATPAALLLSCTSCAAQPCAALDEQEYLETTAARLLRAAASFDGPRDASADPASQDASPQKGYLPFRDATDELSSKSKILLARDVQARMEVLGTVRPAFGSARVPRT